MSDRSMLFMLHFFASLEKTFQSVLLKCIAIQRIEAAQLLQPMNYKIGQRSVGHRGRVLTP